MPRRWGLSAEETDALLAAEHEARELKKLGHLPMFTEQHRYGRDDRIPTDFRVWVACTCGWMWRQWLPDVEAAEEAHNEHAAEEVKR